MATESDVHKYDYVLDSISKIPNNFDIVDAKSSATSQSRAVKRTARAAVDLTGDSGFQHVSHDLWRRYAQRILVSHKLNRV